MEYLVTMTTRVPGGTQASEVDEVRAREAAHTRELTAQGRVLRLWRPPLRPGEWRTIGLLLRTDPSAGTDSLGDAKPLVSEWDAWESNPQPQGPHTFSTGQAMMMITDARSSGPNAPLAAAAVRLTCT